jgi:hypothetical protein
MQVTEHNITDWNLEEDQLNELIRLTREEMKKHSDDKSTEMFYGMILGKLIIMKNDPNV